MAMILGLRQALTRIGCLQALESGPTADEPCLAEMADYDRVYYDSVTGTSLLSAGNQVHEGDECVHTLRARSYERARTHSDWDTLGLYEQGRYRTSFHPGKIVLNRAVHGTKDAVQCFDSYCERTMEK